MSLYLAYTGGTAQPSYTPPGPSSTPYADLVASLGATSYWDLQDTTGTDSIGGHDLTWNATPGTGTGPGGELTSCVSMAAASNQWGSVTHADFYTSQMTLVIWAKFATTTQEAGIIGTYDNGYDGAHIRRGAGSTKITVAAAGGDSPELVTRIGYESIDTTNWWLLAFTYDAANLRCYINGAQDFYSPASSTFGALGYGGEPFCIGTTNQSNSLDHDGDLAGAAFFPSALTAGNISDLYDAVTA